MRKPITLSIEEDLIKQVKEMAIDQDTKVSDIIERWIRGS